MMIASSEGMVNAAGKSYGDLIRYYRRQKGLSQEKLGALAHVKKNAVGAWEAGRSRPDISSIPVLCEALEMPLSIFFGLSEEESHQDVISRYDRLNEYNRQVILRQMDTLYDLQGAPKREPAHRRTIRVYRNDLSAAAGFSYGIGEQSGTPVTLYADALTVLADEIIRVSGNSMEPTFHDGDEVLVQHCTSLREGEIGIFISDDSGYIKEYRKDGLHSHNSDYPVMRFSAEDSVRCVGRVLGILQSDQIAEPDENCFVMRG